VGWKVRRREIAVPAARKQGQGGLRFLVYKNANTKVEAQKDKVKIKKGETSGFPFPVGELFAKGDSLTLADGGRHFD
jgi:hypothetical protein